LLPQNTNRAAARLEGKVLPGEWTVVKRLEEPLDATGGFFSVGYIVQSADGRKGFLKALDYSEAFEPDSIPVSVRLQQLAESINFEQYVLARCRDRGLDKIVISISDGTITMGQPGVDTVEYLIFELADCDVRKQMSIIDKLDILWRFKSLHDISIGLEQLHRNDIIHQDLKPSNVLVFDNAASTLADFGRAACAGQRPPHASIVFAGDLAYAPPDVLYRFPLTEDRLRQLSFDAYLLGSMVVFFFTGQGATPLILNELSPIYADWRHYSGSVDDAKLHLRDAFGKFLVKIDNDFSKGF
jgi:serine/threonine protein kinase